MNFNDLSPCVFCGCGLSAGVFTNLSGNVVKRVSCRGACKWFFEAWFKDYRSYVAHRIDVVRRDLQ